MSTNFTPSSKMDQLFSTLSRSVRLIKGDQVTGEVIKITSQEIIIDLEGKSEGVIPKKDLDQKIYQDIKVGDTITAYIVIPEAYSGQTILSLNNESTQKTSRGKKSPFLSKKWSQLKGAMRSNAKLSGEVLEQNKGGFVIEVEGIRGFLPSSHLSLKTITATPNLVGSTITVVIIESDEDNNRLVLTTREVSSQESLDKINQFKVGDTTQAKIVGVFTFGVILDLGDGIEGVVKVSDLAWERVEDPAELFKIGDMIEAKILGIDSELCRVNLSFRELLADPFSSLAEKYQVDDVVPGVVIEVTQVGIKVSLKDGIEGFLSPGSNKFTLGENTNFLVTGIDQKRRLVNLSPFITSTEGLIYK